MYLIDAEALEKEGWYINRIIQTGKNTMEYQTRKPTEFHAVELERKIGKWIGVDSQCRIGCPFCGTPIDDFCSSIDYIDLNYEPNFCPNCGADMRGEQNEID